MTLKKILVSAGLIALTVIFTACSNSKPKPKESYKPLDLSRSTQSFKSGAQDGCKTADGKYTKNHKAFNNDIEYHEGWFAGRRNCQGRPR
ncbi:MAG: hypothetical protein U9R27_00100 [Campylobacterota bacterium]|nr:hypothetical protein [Campylobacterota bacterium]